MNEQRDRKASNDAATAVTADMPAVAAAAATPQTVVVPLRAAKGDDDLMSQPPQLAILASDETKAAWLPRIPAARIAWSKLTEDELRKTEGNVIKLASLVRDRYAMTRHASELQVHNFLAQPVH